MEVGPRGVVAGDVQNGRRGERRRRSRFDTLSPPRVEGIRGACGEFISFCLRFSPTHTLENYPPTPQTEQRRRAEASQSELSSWREEIVNLNFRSTLEQSNELLEISKLLSDSSNSLLGRARAVARRVESAKSREFDAKMGEMKSKFEKEVLGDRLRSCLEAAKARGLLLGGGGESLSIVVRDG